MTEDEAKTKWCPHARISKGTMRGEIIGPSVNREAGSHAPCLASECMAARWEPDHEIMLGNGMTAIVDRGDAHLTKGIWWDGKYPKSTVDRLHRLVYVKHFGHIPDGLYVDHKDGDTLNNRSGNLRLVTPRQSGANQKSRGGKSKYRGVSQAKSGNWVVQISAGGSRECVGTYDSEHDAAKAYDEKAKKIHGDFARLNFGGPTNSGRKFYCGLAGR